MIVPPGPGTGTYRPTLLPGEDDVVAQRPSPAGLVFLEQASEFLKLPPVFQPVFLGEL